VQPGETLDAIAHRYATPSSSISAVNQKVQIPEAGDLLVIPAGYPLRASARPSSAPVHHRATRHTAAYKTAALATKHRSNAN
jgi:hypothetical protein